MTRAPPIEEPQCTFSQLADGLAVRAIRQIVKTSQKAADTEAEEAQQSADDAPESSGEENDADAQAAGCR